MEIEKIEGITLFLDNTYYKYVQNFPKSRSVSSKTDADKEAGSPKEIGPDLSEAAKRLQQMNQQLDQIAKTAITVRDELTTMRYTLPSIPPNSPERMRYLKGFFGLRKLIEELTIPPNPDYERLKEELNIPKLSGQATDQEVDAVILAINKQLETIQEKRASLASG